jgi:hypothetical protein
MEGRAKVTKEVLCEAARFILANVMTEARSGRQNRYDDIRLVCEGAVSIPVGEYIGFLEQSGYLRHDRVLVGDSPMASIKFRPGAEEPLAGTPVEADGEDGDKKASHRPYSFRRNKKI